MAEEIKNTEVIENKGDQANNTTPVSYTHLDVYKRQCYDCSGCRK